MQLFPSSATRLQLQPFLSTLRAWQLELISGSFKTTLQSLTSYSSHSELTCVIFCLSQVTLTSSILSHESKSRFLDITSTTTKAVNVTNPDRHRNIVFPSCKALFWTVIYNTPCLVLKLSQGQHRETSDQEMTHYDNSIKHLNSSLMNSLECRNNGAF